MRNPMAGLVILRICDRVLDQNEIEAKVTRGHAASVEPEGKLSTVWGHLKSQY